MYIQSLTSADKSKYGYRMLQRMGWEEGKGLGSNEEGQTEHIKVKVKRDNKGKLVQGKLIILL